MSNTLLQKASRQFSPLILYHKYDSLGHQNPQNQQQCQPHIINIEARICQHLSKTNEMLERNAQLWTAQGCASYANLSDEAAPHKKGFVDVILANETTTDQNENDIIDIIPSSSISSTLSNSSTDSNDSMTIVTTPVCSTKMIPMSSLLITSPSNSPAMMPLEPKANNSHSPSLYHPNIYTIPNIYCRHPDRQHLHHNQSPQSSHPEANESPSPAKSVPPYQYHSDINTATTKFVASFTSSPQCTRSKGMNHKNRYYGRNHPRATEFSPPSTTSHFSHPLGQNSMGAGIKKRRRSNLPKHITEYLKTWLLQHKEHPYPTERQKLELAQRTELAVNQISNWFINARRRILHPMLETEQQLQQQLRHQQPHHPFLCMNDPSTFANQDQPRYYPSMTAYSTPSRSPILRSNA